MTISSADIFHGRLAGSPTRPKSEVGVTAAGSIKIDYFDSCLIVPSQSLSRVEGGLSTYALFDLTHLYKAQRSACSQTRALCLGDICDK